MIEDGEEITYEGPPPTFKVKINYPEGPIKWEGFIKGGHYKRVYENGAITVISAEILKDDKIPYSPGI